MKDFSTAFTVCLLSSFLVWRSIEHGRTVISVEYAYTVVLSCVTVGLNSCSL